MPVWISSIGSPAPAVSKRSSAPFAAMRRVVVSVMGVILGLAQAWR